MLRFLISPHPFSWSPQYALLLLSVIPPLIVLSTVFPCICASFVFSIQAGQQSIREIQLNLSRFDYYLTVYPVGLSLSLRLPDFQIGHSVQ